MNILSINPLKLQNNFKKPSNIVPNTINKTPKQNNSNFISYPNNYYLNNLSFLGKYKATDLIQRIGEENFPSPNIVERLRAYGDSKDYSLYDIHLDYYKDLLECTTLKEAKEKYPEFKDVIDASTIDINSLNKRGMLYKISQGEINGAKLDTLSLDILKKHYGKLTSVANKEEYWGMSQGGITNTAKLLNIKIMNKRYTITASCQSEESKAKAKELWQDPEYRQMQSERMQARNKELWQDPEFRQMMSEKMQAQNKEQWQDPEFRQMMSEKAKEQWQDPEYREKMEIVYKARSEAYNRHPEIRETMQEIAKDFPWLSEILSKKQDELTEEEVKYRIAYYRTCEERMPEYQKIIGEEQKKILAEWGFYED